MLRFACAAACAFAFGLASLPALCAEAAPAPLLTLRDAIDLALASNRDLELERSMRDIRALEVEVEEGKFLPRFVFGPHLSDRRASSGYRSRRLGVEAGLSMDLVTGGDVSLAWSPGVRESTGPGFESWDSERSGEVQLSFRQPLLKDAGPRLATASVRAARRESRSHRLDVRDTVARLVSDVVAAYHAYTEAERERDVRIDALARMHSLFDRSMGMVASGDFAMDDVAQTNAEIASQELELSHAIDAVARARSDLVSVMQVDTGFAFSAPHMMAPAGRLDIPAMALDHALASRADYQRALLRVEGARDDLDLARNDQRWDVALHGSASFASGASRLRPGAWHDRSRSLGLRLEVPFGGVQSASQRLSMLRALAELDEARTEARNLEASVRADARDALREADTTVERLAMAGESLALARSARDIERERFEAGGSSHFAVIVSERDLADAEIALVRAGAALLAAQATLDHTFGVVLERWAVSLAPWGFDAP